MAMSAGPCRGPLMSCVSSDVQALCPVDMGIHSTILVKIWNIRAQHDQVLGACILYIYNDEVLINGEFIAIIPHHCI